MKIVCTKCCATKNSDEFPRNRSRKNGFGSQCKACKRLADAEYRRLNREELRQRYREMIAANPTFWADRYAANREKELARVAHWQRENPEKVHAQNRKFAEANPGYWREWAASKPEKMREGWRRYHERRKVDPAYRLSAAVRSGINRCLISGGKLRRRTFEALGYSPEELMAHLEKQFLPGMSWENYGKDGWHIDHIIPLSVFNYHTIEDIDFRRCWALSNLQPLWAADNLKKNAKLDKPFQPSLALRAPTKRTA